jgi:hypothetical protein
MGSLVDEEALEKSLFARKIPSSRERYASIKLHVFSLRSLLRSNVQLVQCSLYPPRNLSTKCFSAGEARHTANHGVGSNLHVA